MHGELDPIDQFINEIIYFVENYTVFENYRKMDAETKTRYIEKLTLMIVFETSPRKNYDISMETIRLFVRDILEAKAEVTPDED